MLNGIQRRLVRAMVAMTIIVWFGWLVMDHVRI